MTIPAVKRAICLLSGGLDSATCLAIALQEGYRCFCLSFDYGQRHQVELEAARRIAHTLDVQEHQTVRFDLRAFGGSALTSQEHVPKNRSESEMNRGIPATYVPARNTIFLSFALAYAEVTGATDIFIGVNAVDYSGYPDCRPEFIQAYERMANLATKAGIEGATAIKIQAPLQYLSKADIVRKALELGLDVGMTHSCYDPDENGQLCGCCDACVLRRKGFEEAGVVDPVLAAPCHSIS